MKQMVAVSFVAAVALFAVWAPSATSTGGTATLSTPPDAKLVQREGARGIVVLVVKSWTLKIADRGRARATSTWRDPDDHGSRVIATTSSDTSWVEKPDDTSSVEPKGLVPAKAKLTRVSVNEYRYSVKASHGGYPVRGVWIGVVSDGTAQGYRKLEVRAPASFKSKAERILDAFAKQASVKTTGVPAPPTTAGVPKRNLPVVIWLQENMFDVRAASCGGRDAWAEVRGGAHLVVRDAVTGQVLTAGTLPAGELRPVGVNFDECAFAVSVSIPQDVALIDIGVRLDANATSPDPAGGPLQLGADDLSGAVLTLRYVFGDRQGIIPGGILQETAQ